MEPQTSQDVENERLKLQNDIQKIQDTLYEDSYSEYDSSDDSCLEIDLGNSGRNSERNQSTLTVTDDDARTHSSLGESSTSHFEGTEISEVTDYEQEISVGDADSTELPVSVESCLALNRAYQEVIVDVLRQIEASLEENRQKQQECEKDVICRREKSLNSAQSKVLYKHFSMPYIKDPAGGGPPPNEDVRIKQLMKEHKQDIPPDRDWLNRDRKKLYEAIAEDALQQLLQPLMVRQELEQDKLERSTGKEAAAIRARIAAIEEDMAQKRKTSRLDLIKNVDTAKTDWMKISNIAYGGRKTWQDCQMMWNNVLSPKVNRGKWEPEEEKQLVELCRINKGKNWEKVAADLQTGRTAFQCLQHFQMNLNPENCNRPWTNEEDGKLLMVVNDIRHSGHRLLWSKVSSYMENRSGTQCFCRFQQIDPDMKRGPWSTEEDVKLFAAVKMCGTQSWMRLAEFVPGRSSIQCRDRWLNSLDPSIRMGNWTYEEDKELLKAITELGTKSWTKIAAKLNGRTDNMVLQRYRRLETWQRKCKWFDELPETTKRALLGGHLSSDELKEREQLTWRNFQEGMGVLKEDYEKQERDRQKGDIVVPRPPPLLGYGTSARQSLIEHRVHLHNIILKHVRSIRNSDIADAQDGDVDTAEKLAAQIHYAHHSNMSVKKLIELTRKVKGGFIQARGKTRLPSKRNFNFGAVERNRRLERSLREAVHSIYKTKKKMKKGRPRKFYNRTLAGKSTEQELHQIKVKSLNIVMKALDVDPRTMLENAAKFKNMKSAASTPSSTTTSTSATPSSTPARTPAGTPATPSGTPAGTPGTTGRKKGSKRRQSKAGAQKEAKKTPPPQRAPEPMEDLDMLLSAQSERTQEDDGEDVISPDSETAGHGEDNDAPTRRKKSVSFVQSPSVKTVEPASRERFTRVVTKTVLKPDPDKTPSDQEQSSASMSVGTSTQSSDDSCQEVDGDEPPVRERSLPYLPPM
ncbi:snRNA-activating protein complex subunit 4-like isoform X2 [Haliotis rubra]|uniref:snRNA-activating protein complex subunit 4-like isoform X2 n=1 Tax=Haliotis rubra TaxID=36100 RepID=UPI001EE54DEC|nr:snRNA-activating protein complex subunit 4-like isoform X2 [Haliotis rubra]